MRRILNIGNPSNRYQHNKTINAVNKLNGVKTQFGFSEAPPTIGLSLWQYECWDESAWIADSAANAWRRLRGTTPIIGLPKRYWYAPQSRASLLRSEARYQFATYGEGDYNPSWGYLDKRNLTAGDFTLNGDPGWMYSARSALGPGPLYYTGDYWSGYNSPDEPPPGTYTEVDVDNWKSGGYGMPTANGDIDGSQWMGIYPFDVFDGPGWDTCPGHEGNGLVQQAPMAEFSSPFWAFGNYVGGMLHEPTGGTYLDGHWYLGALVHAGGIGLGLPELCKGMPDGTIINEAKCEVLGTGLVRYSGTTTTVVTDVDTGALSTTSTNDYSYDNISFVLYGGKRVGTQYEWTALGNSIAAPSFEDEKWKVIDCKGIIESYLATRSDGYHAYGLVPAPFTELFTGGDNKSFLGSLPASVTWDYWENPAYDPPTMIGEEAIIGGGEFAYISSSSGQYVTWDSIQVNNVYINFTLPDSEEPRVINAAFPIMGDLGI